MRKKRCKPIHMVSAGVLGVASAAMAQPTGQIRVLALEGEAVVNRPGHTIVDVSNIFQAGPGVTPDAGVWFHARVREDATGEFYDGLFQSLVFGGSSQTPPPMLRLLEGDRRDAFPADWVFEQTFNPIAPGNGYAIVQGRYGEGPAMPGPTNDQDDVLLLQQDGITREIWREGETVGVPMLGGVTMEDYQFVQTTRRGDYLISVNGETHGPTPEFVQLLLKGDHANDSPEPVAWSGEPTPWEGDDGQPLTIDTIYVLQSTPTDDGDVLISASLDGVGASSVDQGVWIRRRNGIVDTDWPAVRMGDTVRLRGNEFATVIWFHARWLTWEGTSKALIALEVDPEGLGVIPVPALYVINRSDPPELAMAQGDPVRGLGPIDRLPGFGGPAGGQPIGAGITESGRYAFRTFFTRETEQIGAIVHADILAQRLEGVAATGGWAHVGDDTAEMVQLGELAYEGNWLVFEGAYRTDEEGGFYQSIFVRDQYGNVAPVLTTGDTIDLGEGETGLVDRFLLWDGLRGRALNQLPLLSIAVEFEGGRSALLGIELMDGSPCGPADLNQDGALDFDDVLLFLTRFIAGSPSVDQTFDRALDFDDVLLYLERFQAGCS